MKIDITYHCSMGCTHCLSDCRPNNQHMPMPLFRDALLFAKLHASSMSLLMISGGEPFEHPEIKDILTVLARAAKNHLFPAIIIATNGAALLDHPELYAYTKAMLKAGRNRLGIQITNDPRFYPRVFSKQERHHLLGLTSDICQVEKLSQQGRARKNFPETVFSRRYPSCGNTRLLAHQVSRFQDLLELLQSHGYFCTPSIGPDGKLRAGESALCPPFGSIREHDDVLLNHLRNFTCKGCPYPLRKHLNQAFQMLQMQSVTNWRKVF